MTNHFQYRHGILHAEDVDLPQLAASYGTPLYVYSANMIRDRYRAYDQAFAGLPHKICYAVKANSNLAVLTLLANEGAGFDIVSAGELFRVLKAGGDPEKVVFSGVGKTEAEIRYALSHGIHSFNCESEPEIDVLNRVAGELGQSAKVSLRVNPDVNPVTHPYISTGLRENKFGIDSSKIEAAYAYAAARPHLRVTGVSCHIGSLMMESSPMEEAVAKLKALALRLQANGLPIDHLDLGGGLGIAYEEGEQTPSIDAAMRALRGIVEDTGLTIFVEPGRSIVGEAGILLTRVLYTKQNGAKHFVIVDGAMNDLIRPSLYKAYHRVLPVREDTPLRPADLVGPVCESGDFLAKDRELPDAQSGDLLALMTAGAYGFAMASNYNSRPRPAEVMVEGRHARVVRERERFADLVRGE
ncbi:MAG: diaminopimelate decarboxylase [Bryobacter sp.]|nr:diaminopimelate decarboxylase [Bryobacter sp.]